MTDHLTEADELPAPENWLEEAGDALHLKRKTHAAVSPEIVELVAKVTAKLGSDDGALTGFLIGFGAAKDGDFSRASVTSRILALEALLDAKE